MQARRVHETIERIAIGDDKGLLDENVLPQPEQSSEQGDLRVRRYGQHGGVVTAWVDLAHILVTGVRDVRVDSRDAALAEHRGATATDVAETDDEVPQAVRRPRRR